MNMLEGDKDQEPPTAEPASAPELPVIPAALGAQLDVMVVGGLEEEAKDQQQLNAFMPKNDSTTPEDFSKPKEENDQ